MNRTQFLICLILFFFFPQSCQEDELSPFEYGSMFDIEGNEYKTVKIGTQTWMAENLKTSKYSDGTIIPCIIVASAWSGLMSGAYCWYDNEASNKNIYGALYNWSAAMNGKSSSNKNPSGVLGVCPIGWHLPSDAEWNTLSSFLGGEVKAGGKMKESGTKHWKHPNFKATNESGFSGLPGGYCHFKGYFDEKGYMGHWWSSTEPIDLTAWSYHLMNDQQHLARYGSSKRDGLSVRCVKDN